jgi:hypothetical protein
MNANVTRWVRLLAPPVGYVPVAWLFVSYAMYQRMELGPFVAGLLVSGALLVGGWVYLNRRRNRALVWVGVAVMLTGLMAMFWMYYFQLAAPTGWDSLTY